MIFKVVWEQIVVRNHKLLENQVRLQKEIDFIVKNLLRSCISTKNKNKNYSYQDFHGWLCKVEKPKQNWVQNEKLRLFILKRRACSHTLVMVLLVLPL